MESLAVGMMNIYQNNLIYLVNNESLSMYADDHQLYVMGQTVDCVEKQLNEGGHTISHWYKDNFINGNYKKYNVMLLGKNKEKPSIKDPVLFIMPHAPLLSSLFAREQGF